MLNEIIILSIISILILFIRNKKLNLNNLDLNIKGYKILLIMAVIEITAQFLFKLYSSNSVLKILSYHWLIYPVLLFVTSLNWNKHYMKLFYIGTLLNFAAIFLNDYKMPVLINQAMANADKTILYLNSGKDLIHTLLTNSTNVKILCDIITLPPPYPFVKTISIGDIFLLAAFFVFWQESYKVKS